MDYKTLFTILAQQNGVYILVKDAQDNIVFVSDEKAKQIESQRKKDVREQYIHSLDAWYDVQVEKDEISGYTIETYYSIDLYIQLLKEADIHFVVKNDFGKILFCSDDFSKTISETIDPSKKIQYVDSVGKWIRCKQEKATLGKNRPYNLECYTEVTELVEENNELKIDELTGLYNRHGIIEQLKKLVEQTHTNEFVVIIGDIDYFKLINDQYGHTVGDIVLKSVGSILNKTVQNGFCGRYGGEEFLIVLNSDDIEEAFKHVEQIRKTLEQTKFHIQDKEIHITMSFGISKYNKLECNQKDNQMCISKMIQKSDIALMASKQTGRNKTLIYNDNMIKNPLEDN